jgi:hypothetical protein
VLLVAGSLILGLMATLPAGADRPSLTDPPPGAALGAGVEQITPGLPPLHVLEELAAATTTTTWIPAPEIQVSAASLALPPPVGIPMDAVQQGGHLPDWAWDQPGDLSFKGMAAVMMAVGCPASVAPIMAAIGQAESRGRTDAVGDVHLQGNGWGPSVSFMQVRTREEQRGTGGNRDVAQLHDLWFHARAAFEISEGCTNAYPWSTWRFGQAFQHLPAAIDATLWLRGAR